MTGGRPWTVVPDGVILAVRVTPRGGSDRIESVERAADGRSMLKVRVRAAASEGAANAALIKLIAWTLDVAARDVTLVSGATARFKRVKVVGPGAELVGRLERMRAVLQ